MTRRGILSLLLSVSAPMLPAPARLAAAASSGTVARNLRLLLVDRASACAIGQVHLATRPLQVDIDALVKEVAADGLPLDAPIHRAGPARRWLRARIRQDFAEAKIGIVDGWRLSLTELRLCTLAALLKEGQ
jgi:hypothetical protein